MLHEGSRGLVSGGTALLPLPERRGLETVNLETSVISLRRLLFKRHVWLAIYILFFTSNLFVFHVVFFGERKIDFKM